MMEAHTVILSSTSGESRTRGAVRAGGGNVIPVRTVRTRERCLLPLPRQIEAAVVCRQGTKRNPSLRVVQFDACKEAVRLVM
jgi:hypothetical protein